MMIHLSSQRDTSGFTLLEVMIATAIFVISISIVYTLYSSVTGVVASVEAKSGRDLAAKTMIDRLSEDLSSVYVSEEGYLVIQSATGFDEDEPFLEIITTAYLQLDPDEPPVDISLVRYYLKTNEGSETFSLLRSDTPVVGDPAINVFPEKQKHLLSAEIADLQILSIGQDGEEYEEWDSVENFEDDQDVMVRFPKSFNITLRLGSDDENDAGSESFRKRVTPPQILIEFDEG